MEEGGAASFVKGINASVLYCGPELRMDWIHPWIRLDSIELGPKPQKSFLNS